jgi:hypothetical protein
MFIPRLSAEKAFSTITGHPRYEEVMEIVRKNSYDAHYMVGGMVYRNLAIAYHKEKDENVLKAAGKADFDFLVLGKPRRVCVPSGWRIREGIRSSYGGYHNERKHSITLVSSECKIDLISINDIAPHKKKAGLLDYFAAVPLDVQAVAALPEHNFVVGHGINAIVSRTVKLQNRNGLIFAPAIPSDAIVYAETKARSLGFRFLNTERKTRGRVCTCPSRDLFWHGCRCGGI